MVVAILVCFLLPLWFWAGWKLSERRSADYRKRWKEALALYEAERSKPLAAGATPNEYRELFTPRELLRAQTERYIEQLAQTKRGIEQLRLPSNVAPKHQSGPKDAQRVLDSIANLDSLAHDANKILSRSKSAPRMTALRLRSLSDQQRYETEGARLDNDLDVIDDLIDMNGHWTAMMLKRRAEHGID